MKSIDSFDKVCNSCKIKSNCPDENGKPTCTKLKEKNLTKEEILK